jgi:hypothetical protein
MQDRVGGVYLTGLSPGVYEGVHRLNEKGGGESQIKEERNENG